MHICNMGGWLRLVGSIKLQVSFAKETYKRDYVLQKRPVVLSTLLTVATPYVNIRSIEYSFTKRNLSIMYVCKSYTHIYSMHVLIHIIYESYTRHRVIGGVIHILFSTLLETTSVSFDTHVINLCLFERYKSHTHMYSIYILVHIDAYLSYLCDFAREICHRVSPRVQRKGLTTFARRNKAYVFSLLYILKLDYRQRCPLKSTEI